MRIVLFAAAVVAVFVVQPAFAQSSTDLQTLLQRLERLERDVRTLNVQVARGVSAETATEAIGAAADDGANLPAMARLEVRITALEEDLRQATGSMETLSFRIRELAQTLETFTNDAAFRLDALEKAQAAQSGQGAQSAQSAPAAQTDAAAAGQPQPAQPAQAAESLAPTRGASEQTLGTVTPQEVEAVQTQDATAAPAAQQTQTPQPAAATAAQTASLTPEDQYKQAFGLLRQARYDEAETALQGFLTQNGDHRLAGNARYWLGETYYVRGQYLEAAETFLTGYQSDPNGPKAPDTLLKLGMALAGLDQKTEACQTFEKLEREFPKPAPGIAGTLTREKQRNGC
jgi:tol-pal system protein YbgF